MAQKISLLLQKTIMVLHQALTIDQTTCVHDWILKVKFLQGKFAYFDFQPICWNEQMVVKSQHKAV